MAANDRYINSGHIQALLLGIEGLGTDDVEGGDTEHLALVIHSQALEGLDSDGNGGVDGVGDDVQDGLRRTVCVLRRDLDMDIRPCQGNSVYAFIL